MKKKKTIWRRVKASRRIVRVFRRWIWQKPLDAFLWVVGLIGTVLFAVLILVMFNECVECWAKEVLGVGRKKDAIQFVALGIAGVLAIFGAVAVNRRAAAQIQTVRTQVKNNELVERGHIQERFKAAVGHLGSKDESERIASFYEFSYLARGNNNLREDIFDILRAHLRRVTASDKYKVKFADEKNARTTEEVENLLNVLFRSKDGKRRWIFAGFSPTLREIFLMQANLYRAYLQGATLQYINLRYADLREADLRDATLQEVDLQYALLHGAKLQGANLQGAKLRCADLQGADLQRVNLRGADLENADLQWVDFEQAELQTANFQGATLCDAYLQDVDLWGADFRRAYLWRVDLQSVRNLETVKLSGAKIKGAIPPDGFQWPADVDND